MGSKNQGFTLIELLVVIAIIAILAAILFPVLVGAKESANKTKCLNNMSQIAKGMMMYADDNRGALPIAWEPPSNWNAWDGRTFRWAIKKYLRNESVFKCPVPNHETPHPSIGHYGMNTYICQDENGNYFVNGDYNKPYVRILSSVPFPAVTIMVAENKDGDWSAEPWNNDSTGDAGKFWPYHSSGSNKGGIFAFCDGHCSFMSVLKTEERNYFYWKVSKRSDKAN